MRWLEILALLLPSGSAFALFVAGAILRFWRRTADSATAIGLAATTGLAAILTAEYIARMAAGSASHFLGREEAQLLFIMIRAAAGCLLFVYASRLNGLTRNAWAALARVEVADHLATTAERTTRMLGVLMILSAGLPILV